MISPLNQSQQGNVLVSQLTSLFNWMKLTRKSHSRLADVSLLFQLLNVPMSQNEKKIFLQIMDKQKSPEELEQKKQLDLDQFLDCFIIPQEQRKPKQKQLKQAFKYVLQTNQRKEASLRNTIVMEQGSQNLLTKKDEVSAKANDRIDFKALGQLFTQQGYDNQFTNSILKQIEQWDDGDGNFKFKDFAENLYS